MAEYTQEEVDELYDQLILKLAETADSRPPDGHVPGYKYMDAVKDAFEDSPVDTTYE